MASIEKLKDKFETVGLATDDIETFAFDDLGKVVNSKRRKLYMRLFLKPPRIVIDLKDIEQYATYDVTFFVFDRYTRGEKKVLDLAPKWDKTTDAGKKVIAAIAASHPDFVIVGDPVAELGQHKHNDDMAGTKFDLRIRVWDGSLC